MRIAQISTLSAPVRRETGGSVESLTWLLTRELIRLGHQVTVFGAAGSEVDGELVACGGWSRRDKLYTGSGAASDDVRLLDPATEPARVRAMFVRSDWTRRGLGRRILEACEAAAKAEGFRMLTLLSTMPGLPLYENYGFRILERMDVAMPDGVIIGGATMEKPIA